MRRAILSMTALLIGWTLMAAEETPKAEVILDKYFEVTGGRDAYKKIRTQITTGTMEFMGKGIRATITSYKAEPKKSYNVIEIEGIGKIEQGANGDVVWERSALQGPRLKDGEEKAAALREAALSADWRDLYKKAESAGTETIGDQVCYKVILTPDEGKPETRYYDKKSNLLVKVVKTVKTGMGEIPAEIMVSDYKDVGAIRVPHKLLQKGLGQEFLIVIEKVQHNAEIPKDRFDLPDDVKALVEKSKSGK